VHNISTPAFNSGWLQITQKMKAHHGEEYKLSRQMPFLELPAGCSSEKSKICEVDQDG